MSNLKIMVVGVNHRVKNAAKVQNLLTQYGCLIKVRLGLHEHIEAVAGEACSPNGLIVLQVAGDSEELEVFLKELNSIEGVNAKIVDVGF
ncbi:hypothetical protein Sgly_3047 [Syntrophobotulus glycolicus DSM 8271]|uniref:Iron-only hydrogenase system regulator n=1 Tax=Syntrophobotulus glycolicus (strain DSM 8271 / FlGlyR) TaxID=645991 RepID=F0T0E4_SYNGF|nr:hypothetical protein [Syntrophobotulus glycolicus]ADY57316.1 hypothetical protein Sgly_3047 [Syntrophobotulus glycolicus DSM 8271]